MAALSDKDDGTRTITPGADSLLEKDLALCGIAGSQTRTGGFKDPFPLYFYA